MESASQIRYMAREQLRGRWGTAALIMFIYSMLSSAVSAITDLGMIVQFLIGGPLSLGLAAIFLRLTRGEDIKVEMLFDGFKDFGRSFMAMLLMSIYIFLWVLLLIVPGIIAALSYSMTFYILHENPGMPASDAIRHSKEMMYGHKMELFVLNLSFLGWAILCIFTLGIGFFWLGAYAGVAQAEFYQQLKSGRGSL